VGDQKCIFFGNVIVARISENSCNYTGNNYTPCANPNSNSDSPACPSNIRNDYESRQYVVDKILYMASPCGIQIASVFDVASSLFGPVCCQVLEMAPYWPACCFTMGLADNIDGEKIYNVPQYPCLDYVF
jgi:hypothetical protein